MMSQEERVYFVLMSRDGRQFRSLMSFEEFLQKINALGNKIDHVEREISIIKHKIRLIEQPKRKQMILDLLKREGKARTPIYIFRRVPDSGYDDLAILIREGKIETEIRGKRTLYKLKQQKEES